MPEFNRLVDKCTKLATEVADRIQVLDGKLGESKKNSPTQELKNGWVFDTSKIARISNDRCKKHLTPGNIISNL